MKLKILLIEPKSFFFEKLQTNEFFDLTLKCEADLTDINIKDPLLYDAVIVSGNTNQKTPFEHLKFFNTHFTTTPVFLLLEENNNNEIIHGYEMGMSGVIVWPKPINRIFAKLTAEINKTKRLLNYTKDDQDTFSLDENLMELEINKTSYSLTPIECELLKILQNKKNHLVKKEELIHEIWPNNDHPEGALNTHFYNLKKKIPILEKLLRTKKRVGYILKIPELVELTSKITETSPEKNILVIDDDLEVLEVINDVLHEDYENIFKADSTKMALEIINKEKIDLILLDLYMAPEDGFTFMKKLYEMTITIPVIILSGYHSAENQQKAKNLGVQEFISKPFDDFKLLESVGTFLRG